MNLQEIRERRAARTTAARAIVAKAETEKRQLTADESAQFDTIKGEITELDAAEQLAQFLDDTERRMQGVVITGNGGDNFAQSESRVSLLRVLQAGIEGRALDGVEGEVHAELERRHGRGKHGGLLVPLSVFNEQRANTTTSAAGLVGTDHRADLFIGPLRNSLAVKALGVRTLVGLTGNVHIPKHGTGLCVGWVTEGGDLPESSMTADGVTLSPHHVGGITEMSRQLIQQSSPDIEQLVRDDLSFAIAAAVDTAIVSGSGLLGQPQGIIGRAGVQIAGLPATWQAVLAIEQQLAGANVKPSGWYTGTQVMTTLRGTLKEAGLPGYIATANAIGDLSAASSNAAPAGTAILGAWDQVMVGQWGAVELLLNPFAEAPYRRGGVLVRAFLTCDVQCRHEQGFVVATAP